MEELNDLFNIANLVKLAENELKARFAKIAEKLCNCYYIKKGSVVYEFLEIEFYLYSENHPDIITYPRNANMGDWFFHQSGVDLCFNTISKDGINWDNLKIVPSGVEFGGILIRGLKKSEEGKECQNIVGPLKCCYELFDRFSAINENLSQYPYVKKKDYASLFSLSCSKRRLNFKDRKATYGRLNALFENAKVDERDFIRFMEKNYRFCVDLDSVISK